MRPSCGVSVVIAAACMCAYAVECKSVEHVQLLVGVFITPQTPFELRQAFRNATRGVLPRVRLVFFVGIEGNFSEEQRAHGDIVQGICSFPKAAQAPPQEATQTRLFRYTDAAPPTGGFDENMNFGKTFAWFQWASTQVSAAFPKATQNALSGSPLGSSIAGR